MNADISGGMYKIGTNWAFDVASGKGYYVEKENEKVKGMKVVFTLEVDGDAIKECYNEPVPSGVIRKAKHLLEIVRENKLTQQER